MQSKRTPFSSQRSFAPRAAGQLAGMRRSACCISVMFAMAACGERPVVPIIGADAARGKAAIERHACVACHTIPGIGGPDSNVGPPLAKIARRAYLGGVVPNVPSEMIRWLRDAPGIDPRTAMPAMAMPEAEARDIAAYLYTLD